MPFLAQRLLESSLLLPCCYMLFLQACQPAVHTVQQALKAKVRLRTPALPRPPNVLPSTACMLCCRRCIKTLQLHCACSGCRAARKQSLNSCLA